MSEEPKLPDFDDLVELAGEIGKLKKELLLSKAQLDYLKANITEKVTSDNHYFVKGKPPSMSYIESHYHNLGYNKETKENLLKLQTKIAQTEGDLKEKELLFEIYRAMIDVWRTESANRRGSFFEG